VDFLGDVGCPVLVASDEDTEGRGAEQGDRPTPADPAAPGKARRGGGAYFSIVIFCTRVPVAVTSRTA